MVKGRDQAIVTAMKVTPAWTRATSNYIAQLFNSKAIGISCYVFCCSHISLIFNLEKPLASMTANMLFPIHEITKMYKDLNSNEDF